MLMKTDALGIPRFTNKDLIDMIYTGHVDKCHVVLCDESDDVELFNKAAKKQGIYYLLKFGNAIKNGPLNTIQRRH
mgnify:CR=1 FL=1